MPMYNALVDIYETHELFDIEADTLEEAEEIALEMAQAASENTTRDVDVWVIEVDVEHFPPEEDEETHAED